MRLTRLDLLRFGKFTDEILTLPHSKQDFHLVVGPNEAGKSTLRNAIQDLLFGIETRSRYNFLHAHSDMRLGALIEQGSLSLDFVRTKARTRTLQKPDGSTLRDDALVPFLGSVDRVFFDQMFGLNHERLVKGGQDILSASNNMGQILFQAAAGIGSLGVIRDRMEQEADGLWGPRKSDKREYYLAASALEQAEAALKNATVRTREWQEAAEAVEGWSSQLLAAHATYNDLAQHRFQLERVRRVGPMLLRLALIERELAELGPVVLLPAQAGAQLAQAEHELAMAGQSLQMHQEKLIELTESSASLRPDSTILARTSDIEALCAFRQKVSQHETDIAKRESEIRVQWLEVQESARQLAWPTEDEDAIAQRLPGALARLDLEELLGRHGVLLQAQSATDEALRGRQDEIKAIGAEISLLPAVDIPVMLVEALSAGRALGDSGAQEQRLEAQVARGERELHAAGLELGFGKFDLDELRQLVLPGQDECAALIRTRAAMEAELLTIRARRSEIQADESILRLEIAQYQATHKPVTQSDVMKVRHERDTRWQAIKAGDEAMAEGATGYESAVSMADHLADLRHGKAQQETELQSRLDRLQRLHLQVADLAEREQGAAVLLSGFEQVWNERAQSLGLPGLALMQVNEYRLARERVLNLATVLWEARSAQAAFTGLMSRACSELALAMQALQPHADALTLSALILSAEQWIGEATRTRERRSALTTQMIRAQAALESLESRASLARAAIDAWTIEMHKSLAQAHLPIDCSPVKAKAALGLFERMHQHLQKIRETRLTRINLMRQDLDDFAGMATALALHVAPALSADRPADISMQLDAQLKLHAAQAQQLARLTSEIDKVMAQLGVAKARVAQAHASLEPLLRASGAQNHAELRDAIVKSERLRQLKIDQDEALGQLLSAGDGLTREALAEEFALTDTSAAVTLLSDNQRQTDVIVSTQNRLSVELTEAQAVLGQIAGQGEAALAESQRQEALARMGNALERFIKVFTAAKLLRWSIEKFRETRQGPMLTCASQIFSGLTQGAFSKLVVDYENDPPKLSGQRATGEHVDIEGLSEGTRDQLYLALRLAALELHLEKTTPLPFIGDDLFINYDDGRARAGLQALARLSESTQVIFLSHHAHLVPLVRDVFGAEVNVIRLG